MSLDSDGAHAESEALVGRVIGGRYRLDAVLGVGAMGTVFRAYHTGLQRDVALKLLHRDWMASDQMQARFSREAAAISKLDHPNCVRVSDFGSDDHSQYLVMELLQGTVLNDELEQPMPPLRAIELVDEVLAGLAHAHGHGLIHRDIKPDNIFLSREADGRVRPKLLDFGIVKLKERPGEQQLTQVGMVFGTPHFMSPEQAMGSEVDVRSDLYAMGVVLYTMLAGGEPFASDDPVTVLHQQIEDAPPPLPPTVPGPLQQVVMRLLAKQPEHRYASAKATQEALAQVRQLLSPPPVPAPALSPSTPITANRGRWTTKMRWIAGGGGAAVLAIGAMVVVAGGDRDARSEDVPAGAVADGQGDGAGLVAEDGSEQTPANSDGAARPSEAASDEQSSAQRGLQASLASIDALISAKKYEAALITLGPLLEAHPNEGKLHWRMATTRTALGGVDNRVAALRSYSMAIGAEPSLTDDETFMAELKSLMGDARLREAAVDLALERLDAEVDDDLVAWLNVQTKPLGYVLRHRIIDHLEGNERGGEINRPLQWAFDLWQAGDASDPCDAFGRALDHAHDHPDSFLLGTLHNVPMPTASSREGQDPMGCTEQAKSLENIRAQYDRSFAGIEPIVPKAFRPRRARSSTRRRGR